MSVLYSMRKKTTTFRSDSRWADRGSFPKPGGRASNPSERWQTLVTLLSELMELKDNEGIERSGAGYSKATDGNQDVHSREGVAIFELFDYRINSLDRQLQAFANAVRQLGSSVGLLNATYHLRGALLQIEHLFRENAADLFNGVKRQTDRSKSSTREKAAERDPVHTCIRPHLEPQTDLELLPGKMDELAEQIHVFVNRLNDIPEFTDELVNASFLSFASDLKYRASCLGEFKGQIKTITVQRHINDLSTDIGTHMEAMEAALENFIDVGVPIIRHAQDHTANGLQYLSAIATFFSGVTATTISYNSQTGNVMADLVNALWIISLIFSIASAINSQLAYHWRAAMYRSPRNFVPWWVSIWIKRSPLFFLIGSVLAFSIGLCVFTYSSNQGRVVSVLVTAFTIVTSFGLISVGLWFMSERWTFSHTSGQRWLLDLLHETQAKVYGALGQLPKDVRLRSTRWLRVQLHNLMRGLKAIYTFCTCRKMQAQTDEEKQAHASDFPTPSKDHPSPGRRSDPGSSIADTAGSGLVSPTMLNEQPPLLKLERVASISSNFSNHPRESTSAAPLLPVTPEGERRPNATRLKSVVEKVMAQNKSATTRMSPRGLTEPDMPLGGRRESSEGYNPSAFTQKTRLQELKSGLSNLQITQSLNEHMALVKHMQFSPNGEFLATCSWDRTALIWKTGDPAELCTKLFHPIRVGGFVSQVEWSPDGGKLLTRTQKAIAVWDPVTGTMHRAINIIGTTHSVSWMPSGNELLSVKYEVTSDQDVTDTKLVRLNMDGQELETHTLERIQIWDTAIMADEKRVVAVGTLRKSTNDLQPSQSRAEKRLLVYNMKTRKIEHHVPLLQEVRNVSLCSPNSKVIYALVSNEDKSPPQLWKIDMKTVRKAGEGEEDRVAKLNLVHSYLPKTPVDFTGQGSFGGPNGTLVCCSSKNGEIHIWDRASATLLHTLRPDNREMINNFACNHKSASEFMLASGALDGTIGIWSALINTLDQQIVFSPETQMPSPVGSVTPTTQRGPSLFGSESVFHIPS